jgi:hypothetical protein
MNLVQTNLSRLKACRKLAGGKAAGCRPGSGSRFVTALKGQGNLGEFRRNDIFVENQPAQDFQLRRSGIGGQSGYAAPTELNDSLVALATNMPLLRSYEMALGHEMAAPMCAGARASARFTVRHAMPLELPGALGLATLKRRERRAPVPAVAPGAGRFSRAGSQLVTVSHGQSRQIFLKNVGEAVSGTPSGWGNLSVFCTPSPLPSPQGEGFHAPSVFENICDRVGGTTVLTDVPSKTGQLSQIKVNQGESRLTNNFPAASADRELLKQLTNNNKTKNIVWH